MLRPLLALLVLCLSSAVGRMHADATCADDGCGCPHEAPSASCCCDAPAAASPRLPAVERAALLEELREGRIGGGPCLVDGGCRGTRRARAQARPGAPACPPSCAAPHVSPLPSVVPCAPAAQRPEAHEPEPSIPPPRSRRAH